MAKVLFWNLHKKSLVTLVCKLLVEHDPDVLLLAECPKPAAFVVAVNTGQPVVYHFHVTATGGLVALSKGGRGFFDEVILPAALNLPSLNGRVAFYHLHAIGEPALLLIGVHLPSKLYLTTAAQAQLAARLRPVIEAVEDDLVKHRRSIVIGDFNMDPFEQGMIGSEAFHALMDRRLVQQKKGQRTVLREKRRLFYNPMWSLMGDDSVGPPGTYYYEKATGPEVYYWHTFDQILFRSALLGSFQPNQVQVLTSAGGSSLLTPNGLPDTAIASDHLPLLAIV